MDIKSIDIVDFKVTLETWVKENPLPLELKRMLLNEVTAEISKLAVEELYRQADEREHKEEKDGSEI